jgi:death on curing protein
VEDIIFLSMDDVLLLHTDTIDIDGGSPGVRDHGLLDAAVAMPRQQFGGDYLHEDLPAMATAYMFHIAQNHPFVDGNKRAAVLSALAFLCVNGMEELPDSKELGTVTLQIAAGEMGKDMLTRWLRNQVSGKK